MATCHNNLGFQREKFFRLKSFRSPEKTKETITKKRPFSNEVQKHEQNGNNYKGTCAQIRTAGLPSLQSRIEIILEK